MRAADVALSQAKSAGHNTWRRLNVDESGALDQIAEEAG